MPRAGEAVPLDALQRYKEHADKYVSYAYQRGMYDEAGMCLHRVNRCCTCLSNGGCNVRTSEKATKGYTASCAQSALSRIYTRAPSDMTTSFSARARWGGAFPGNNVDAEFSYT